jgi:hypothetical protein
MACEFVSGIPLEVVTMRTLPFVLLLAAGLGLPALFPAQAGAGPYGYYGGRYYPSPGMQSSYPVSSSTAPRSFTYIGPVYPLFPSSPVPYMRSYQPTVPSYTYSPPVNTYYSYYSVPGRSYYAQPSATSLYAGSYYP